MSDDKDRRKHPSGRPYSAERPMARLPVPRVPNDEPLTPGLRRSARTEAIGFHVSRPRDEEE